ncbi:hypothetical protein OQA88_7961 [Cercophora sp. LCS_1]
MPPIVILSGASRMQARVARRRAPALGPTAEEWEANRSRLEALYAESTLPQLRKLLAEEGFHASEKQFKIRLKKWGLTTKNVKTSEVDQVLTHIQAAGQYPPQHGVYHWKGKEYPAHKLLRRYKEILSGRGAHVALALMAKKELSRPNVKTLVTRPRSPEVGVLETCGALERGTVPSVGDSPRGISELSDVTSGESLDSDIVVGGSLAYNPAEAVPTESPASSPPTDVCGPQNTVERIFDWILKLRFHTGLSLRMYDFLQFCVDPEYSPLIECDSHIFSETEIENDFSLSPSETDALRLARRDYQDRVRSDFDKFNKFIGGPSPSVGDARDRLTKLIGSKVATPIGSDLEGFNAVWDKFRMVWYHQYPEHTCYTRESLQKELDTFDSIMREVTESAGKFQDRIGRELQAPFERGIRPMHSPAQFFSQTRDTLIFLNLGDPDDPELDYGKIKALLPGPYPGLTMGMVYYSPGFSAPLTWQQNGDPMLWEVEEEEDGEMKLLV